MAVQSKNTRKKKSFKNIGFGKAYIKSSFNNTIITFTDTKGNVVSQASSGQAGFKGSRKSTPFAAGQAADIAIKKAIDNGFKKVNIFISGPGGGKETAVRAIQASVIEVGYVADITPQVHNGCRPKKKYRQ